MTRENDLYRTIKVRKETHYRLKVISLVKDKPITQVIDDLLRLYDEKELFSSPKNDTQEIDP